MHSQFFVAGCYGRFPILAKRLNSDGCAGNFQARIAGSYGKRTFLVQKPTLNTCNACGKSPMNGARQMKPKLAEVHPEIARRLGEIAKDFDEIAMDLESGAVEMRHPELMPQNQRG